METAASCCHSHDFCDADMVFYEVFLRHCMDPATEEGMGRTVPCGTRRGTSPSRRSFESLAEAARSPQRRGCDDMNA